VEDIITTSPQQETYDRIKSELLLRFSSSRDQRVRQLHSMRKWAIGKFGAWLKTSRTISFETSGTADSHPTCKPLFPARPRAVSSQPPTSRTEFSRLFPCLPQLASPLRRSKTRQGYYSGSRSSRARFLHCRHPKHSRPNARVRQR